jgi:large subunit ribosomal protein L10
MDKSQKTAEIGELRNRFDRMVSAVFVDFKGLNVAAVTKLRGEFRKSGVEYKVVKNTLIRHALQDKSYVDQLGSNLVGMTGVA